MKFVFDLPLPPSVNDLYIPRYNPKTRKAYMQESLEAKAYKNKVFHALFQHVVKNGTLQERGIKVHVSFNLTHDRDVDNGIKILFDALTYAKFWLDDRLVSNLSADKKKAKISGCTLIVESAGFSDECTQTDNTKP